MLFRLDPSILTLVLGIVIVCYAAINMFSVTLRVGYEAEFWLSAPVGAFSGILTGLTGSVGAPVAIYFQALGLDKEEFLQAISLSFFLAALVWIPSLANESAFGFDIVLMSILALIPAFAGMWIGRRLRNYLSEVYFRRGVFLFLIVVGLNLIRRAVM
jgi:uncharacterized membrane protein YfcA